MLEKDVGQTMITTLKYIEGTCTCMYLAKAAEIARKEMRQHAIRFTGTFHEVSMTETVPNSLLARVSMTKHDPGIESSTENGITDSDLAISVISLQFSYSSYRQ
jgi:hypothetical protein